MMYVVCFQMLCLPYFLRWDVRKAFDPDYNALGKMDWQYSGSAGGAGDDGSKAVSALAKSNANKFDI